MGKITNNAEAQWLDILAVSALYNVRIIVHEYVRCPNRQIYLIQPTLKTSCPSIHVPVILLTKAKKDMYSRAEWGRICQKHDIAQRIWPNMKLQQYHDLILDSKSTNRIVRCACNQWMRTSDDEMWTQIEDGIFDLIVRYWPQFNVRPIPRSGCISQEDLKYFRRQIAQNEIFINSWLKQ